MRKAINENPVVQVVLLGVLGIAVAFLFMTRVMSSSSNDAEPAPADTASTAPVPGDGSTATPAVPGAAPTPTAPVPAAPAPAAPVPAGAGFEPGAGLPKSVVSAHNGGDVVALLVVNRKGAEDQRLEVGVRGLESRGDTSVFIAEAKKVARYSRIAEGVNLDRVPALVVVEPKSQVNGEELPSATISYGFRGPESLNQAINDVLYKGKRLPFHPG